MNLFLIFNIIILLLINIITSSYINKDIDIDANLRGKEYYSNTFLKHEKIINGYPSYDELLKYANEQHNWIINNRRNLHQYPELMFNEKKTSEYIMNKLNELNITYISGWAKNIHPEYFNGDGGTGIIADIGTGQSPCIALRADIDALPIHEEADINFKSKNDGIMHACGHDGHTSMLLGAAKILKKYEHLLKGTVRLIFQPAEEGGAGGKLMREEGALTKYPPVERAFGFHLWPAFESGIIASKPGVLMAAADMFEATISGIGGHAAMPHQTIDPVLTGAQIITSLQHLVSRETSPFDTNVVSVTRFNTGNNAKNVIPNAVTIAGTFRAFSVEGLSKLRIRIEEVITSISIAHRCNSTVRFSPEFYPPTVNNDEIFPFVRDVASDAAINGTVIEPEPTMGGEDFSFIAQAVPSILFWIGQGSGSIIPGHPSTQYGLHHPKFAIHEDVLDRGAALHAHLAIRNLLDLNYQINQNK